MFNVKKNYAGHAVEFPESIKGSELLAHIKKYYKTAKLFDDNRISVPTKNLEKLERRLNRFKPTTEEPKGNEELKEPKTVDHSTLVSYAKNFLKENYDVDLPVPLSINNRLKTTLGRYTTLSKQPYALQLAGFLLKYYDPQQVYDVLRHELIHVAGHLLNKPYRDGESWFESELRKHNSTSSGTIKTKGPVHSYKCSDCNKQFQLRNKINTKRYSCQCSGKLEYQGEFVI